MDVGQFLGLRPSRSHEIMATVTEGGGHRATAHRVEVAPPGGVLNPDPLAPDDHRVAAIELEGEDTRRVADRLSDSRAIHVLSLRAPSGARPPPAVRRSPRRGQSPSPHL